MYMQISNPTSKWFSLQGWSVTDKSNDADWWTFPDYKLPPKANVLVYASKKDCSPPGIDGREECAEFHTNFKLGKDDGYLALKGPDGTLTAEISYPKQYTDIPYGYMRDSTGETVGLDLPSYLDTDEHKSELSSHSIDSKRTPPFEVGLKKLRPKIRQLTENISPMPKQTQAFPIFAQVDAVPPNEEIVDVRLYYILGFETTPSWLPMLDDGIFPDARVIHSYSLLFTWFVIRPSLYTTSYV
jgi:hypothetical protein